MNDSQELTTAELSDLLTRLIPNLNERTCSISRFCREHKELLQDISRTKQPLVLRATEGHPIALILDVKGFQEIEQRRRRLVELFLGIETQEFQRPTATKKEIFNPLVECFRKAEQLNAHIKRQENDRRERQAKYIDPLIVETTKAKEELEQVEKEKLRLLQEWEKSRITPAS